MTEKRPLIFIGSRLDTAKLAMMAEKIGKEVLGILDYQYYKNTDTICNIPVIGDERTLLDPNDAQAKIWKNTCDFFVATSAYGQQKNLTDQTNNEILRYNRINLLEKINANPINLIDPDSRLLKNCKNQYSSIKIGKGIFIDELADFGITDIEIGDYTCIEGRAYIDHQTRIGKNVKISPLTTLYSIEIGDNSCIGTNSHVVISARTKITCYQIGAWSTVWTDSKIDRHVPDNHILTDTGRILKKYRSLEYTDLV